MPEQKFMTVKQAADYLGTNRQKISTLIKRGVLTPLGNPMDTRQKLIPVEQIEKMKQFQGLVSNGI